MKKRILYVIIAAVVSLFIFSNRVDAVTMYLECNYDSECHNDTKEWYEVWKSEAWTRWCHPDYSQLFLLTSKSGNLVPTALNENGKDFLALDNEGCWLKNNTDKNCSKADTYDYGAIELFSLGACPSGLLNNKGIGGLGSIALGIPKFNGFYTELVPYGQNGQVLSSSDIKQTEYIIYSFVNNNGETEFIAEGYTAEGKYCYIGPDMREKIKLRVNDADEVVSYQLGQVRTFGADYWKIHEEFDKRIIAASDEYVKMDNMNVCNGQSEQWCVNNYSYEVVLGSKDGYDKYAPIIEEWYDDIIEGTAELKNLANIINRNDFIKTSKEFNSKMAEGKKYKFSNSYTKDEFINDLKDAYVAIENAYTGNNVIKDYIIGTGTSTTSSVLSKIYKEVLVDENGNSIEFIIDLAKENKNKYSINSSFIVTAIERDIDKAIDNFVKNNNVDVDIINLAQNIREYMETLYISVAFLDSNNYMYSLDGNQASDIEKLRENFKLFVDENNLIFIPVVDCESLLGEELIAKINSYLDIIKIGVPILVIGFSILDFTKAIFASDEEKMKKAKTAFIKRLFIAILIFLSPIFVNLLLRLANNVWTFISPNTCGLFD